VRDAELDAAARRFLESDTASFTTPGHGRNPAVADALLALDLPLATGVDDLRETQGILPAAEGRAAAAWGADACRFVLNGSTQGNQAMVLGATRPGDTVIVSRTVHKSLFAALVLGGLQPVFVHPELDPATGLPGGMTPARVAAALAGAPAATAVILTEPSYVGVLSDVAAIAELCHDRGVPLLVDGAWGAHLGFHPDLPAHALAQGADVMVLSAHKTLPAFTQSALLLTRHGLIDPRRMADAFELLHTTSPAAAIYASIDRARALMQHRGAALLARTLAQAGRLRAAAAAIDGVALVAADAPGVAALDPTKVIICLGGTGADGFAVEADLVAAGVHVEMADRSLLLPLLHVGVSDTWLDRLLAALGPSIERHRGTPRAPRTSVAFTARPESAMAPRDAFFAAHERVPAARAAGRIAAETVTPYPPGIPALAPGEVVTAELIAALRQERAEGSKIAYCSDPSLDTLVVVSR
jgi:arginine decarboxylase